MVNSLMLFFSLTAVYVFLEGLDAKNGIDYRRLKCSGFLWALAVSTKLVAINLVFFFVPLLLLRGRKNPQEVRRIVATSLIYFLLLPLGWTVGLYLLIPYIAQPDIGNAWAPLLTNLHHHLDTRPTHNFASGWWSWPLILKPTLFYVKTYQWTSPNATCEAIFAMGNPVIFWTLPLAIGNSVWEIVKKHSRTHGIVILGFLSQWMTFALASRLQFFHYFYIAMPFAAISLGLLLTKACGWGKWGPAWVAGYLIAGAAMFVYWYPLLTGMTVSRSYFYHHMWFRGWI
jgi:dolichyl-phosphate-mannose--protein O-mannosyl transferase